MPLRKTPIRILFHLYAPFVLPNDASIQQVIRVCYHLAKLGCNVTLHICSLCFSNKTQLMNTFGFKNFKNLTVEFFPIPIRSGKRRKLLIFWGAVFHLYRFLKLLLSKEKYNYDVFFARGYRFPTLHILFKRFLKYKIVLELHEIIYLNRVSEDNLLKHNKVFDFEKHSFLNADGVIGISHAVKNLAIQKWGKVTPITVIPSGTVTFTSNALPTDRSLRKIYFVGNYYPYSGLDFFLKVLHKIPSATLTIVGGGEVDDPNYHRVKGLVNKYKLENIINFRGFVLPTELPEIYAEADILVLPLANLIRSKYFVSPLKLFEYMAARRPIVASDMPTVREILRDGDNALLAKAEDVDSFRNAIYRLMNDPKLAFKIAEKAYKDVQKYSMENKCKKINDFIAKVIE